MQEVMTALITPFHEDGSIDFNSLEKLIEAQIKNHCDGLIVCGTTAEVPTLRKDEKLAILDFTIEIVCERVPIWYGCGSNCTDTAIQHALEVQNRKIAGLLVVTPYYNRPSQEGLYQHYKAIANQVPLAIMLYNIPSRTGCELKCETLERLIQDCPNIVALKHASCDLELVRCIHKQFPDFRMYSGEDGCFVEAFEAGMCGVVSVMSHLVLPSMKKLIAGGCCDGIMKDKLYECAQIVFCESSPSPLKYILSLIGECENYLRLPLVPLSIGNEGLIRNWLTENDKFLQENKLY